MRPKTIVIIIATGVAILQLTHTLYSATGNMDQTGLKKIDRSPRFREGKFLPMELI